MKIVDWLLKTLLSVLLFLGLLAAALIYMPQTPLPTYINPREPFRVTDPSSFMTHYKLNKAVSNRRECLSLLSEGGVSFQPQGDLKDTKTCGIENRVSLRRIGDSAVLSFDTKCETAVRLMLWEDQVVQPAAQRHFGQSVSALRHFSSYSCRPVRTTGGTSNRMSQHATANAVDIAGFMLADKSLVSVLADWHSGGPKAAFLREVRDGACQWFNTILSPDYNALHADHFHFDQGSWRSCR